MRRCQALLGTFVEIFTDQDDGQAINEAFSVIKQVQDLMSFHDPSSELNIINQTVHLEPVAIHSWTAEVLKIAQEIYEQSNGLFNCGIGHRLVAAGLLPCHMDLSIYQMSGIEDIRFIDPQIIISSKPLCLDLGGIAKGFAVDKAVESLISRGIESACVNAGGDLRVFGPIPMSIQIRNPSRHTQLIDIGLLQMAPSLLVVCTFPRGINYKATLLIHLHEMNLKYTFISPTLIPLWPRNVFMQMPLLRC